MELQNLKSIQQLLRNPVYDSLRINIPVGNRMHHVVPKSAAPTVAAIAAHLGVSTAAATKVHGALSGVYRDGDSAFVSPIAAPTVVGTAPGYAGWKVWSSNLLSVEAITNEMIRNGRFGWLHSGASIASATLASVVSNSLAALNWNISEGVDLGADYSYQLPNLGDVIILQVNCSGTTPIRKTLILDARLGPFVTPNGGIISAGLVHVTGVQGSEATGDCFGVSFKDSRIKTARTPPAGTTQWQGGVTTEAGLSALYAGVNAAKGLAGATPFVVADGHLFHLHPTQEVWGWPSHVGMSRDEGVSHFFLAGGTLKTGLAAVFSENGGAVPPEVTAAEFPEDVSISILDKPVTPPSDFLIGTEIEAQRNESEVLGTVLFPDSEEKYTIRQLKSRISSLGLRQSFITGKGKAGDGGVISASVVSGALVWTHSGAQIGVDDVPDLLRYGAVLVVGTILSTINAAATANQITPAVQERLLAEANAAAASVPYRPEDHVSKAWTGSGWDWARSYGTKAATDQAAASPTIICGLTGTGL